MLRTSKESQNAINCLNCVYVSASVHYKRLQVATIQTLKIKRPKPDEIKNGKVATECVSSFREEICSLFSQCTKAI